MQMDDVTDLLNRHFSGRFVRTVTEPMFLVSGAAVAILLITLLVLM